MSMLSANPSGVLLDNVARAEAGHLPDSGVSAEKVSFSLQKILRSPGFPATERSRKLLEYLVNETLAGREGRIKAYCIGTVVLGRPESFDPQKDPIVRIEAARLRRQLEHYYLTDGAEDRIIIDIPKGAYVPRFLEKDEAEPGSATAPAKSEAPGKAAGWQGRAASASVLAGLLLLVAAALTFGILNGSRHVPAPAVVQLPGLLVKPLADLTHSRDSAVLAQGLTERIIEKTSRFKELAVIPGDSEESQTPTSVARYEFGGTLRDEGGQVVVQTRLVDRMDGRVIWADSYAIALQPQQIFNVEVTIADQIATRIAEPGGIVFEAERRAWLDAPPESLNAYLCTLSAYAYRAAFAAGEFDGVRACLRAAVAAHPDYATAWALLSLVYIDEYRFFYPPPPDTTTPVLDRAYDAARRATELDPTNVRAQQALMVVLFFRKDYQAAIDVGAHALALNPNDLELKGDYGYRLALYGEWAQGCRLVQETMDSSARKSAYYRTALALCSFFGNDMAAATSLVTQAEANDNPAYHVIAAAILAEGGQSAAALAHRQWLEHNAPRQLSQLLTDLPQRLVRPADRARFVAALRKAGFAGAG